MAITLKGHITRELRHNSLGTLTSGEAYAFALRIKEAVEREGVLYRVCAAVRLSKEDIWR